MVLTTKYRQKLQARFREITHQLDQVSDADEETRLLNEQLYLSGILAALDAVNGKNERLFKVLKGRQ